MMMTVFLRIMGVVLIGLAGNLIVKHWNTRQTIVRRNIWHMLELASVIVGIVLVSTPRWDAVAIVSLVMLPIIIMVTTLQILINYFNSRVYRVLENWVRKAREKGNNGMIIKICEQIVDGIRRGNALRELHYHKPNRNE